MSEPEFANKTISEIIKMVYGEKNGQKIIEEIRNAWKDGKRDETLKSHITKFVEDLTPVGPGERKPPVLQLMSVSKNVIEDGLSKLKL